MLNEQNQVKLVGYVLCGFTEKLSALKQVARADK